MRLSRVFLVVLTVFATVGTLSAAVFTVNSSNDPGVGSCDVTECTLREAITAANSAVGADTINFNIPGAGVRTISLNSALPTIMVDGQSDSFR